eukprot:5869222-Pleurochrysis_carterae.AAC.2
MQLQRTRACLVNKHAVSCQAWRYSCSLLVVLSCVSCSDLHPFSLLCLSVSVSARPCVYVFISGRACTCIRSCVHVCAPADALSSAPAYASARACVRTRVRACVHACVRARVLESARGWVRA